MKTFFQLIYISTAKESVGAAECSAILEKALINNARLNITGLLLFNSKRFLQVLEGSEADVRAIFTKIQDDPRHHAFVVLGEKHGNEREFGQWAMAFDDGTANSTNLASKVRALLDRAGPSTSQLFVTSAKLYSRSRDI